MDTVNQTTERLWDQLLQFIDEGRVIPVIGPELLLLEIDGKTTLLYSYLAERLAQRLQLTFQPEDTLNAVVCRYLAQDRDNQREDIYPALKQAMPPLSEFKLPEPLLKLAAILPFKLFVTTCFDPLLAHALNQVRYGGQEKTQLLTFSPESNKDLPVPVEQLDRATVFHLFGNLSAIPDYAVTEEDVLEFMHALQSKTTRPEKLFDALVKQNLIVIGCPLIRLAGAFLRAYRQERALDYLTVVKPISWPATSCPMTPIWRFFCGISAAGPKYFRSARLSLSTSCTGAGWNYIRHPLNRQKPSTTNHQPTRCRPGRCFSVMPARTARLSS